MAAPAAPEAATIAPISAIPIEPPTWRMLFSTAEPTPALSGRTECIAAAVVGAIAADIPTPPSSIAGSRFQNVSCIPIREKRTSEPDSTTIPKATSGRGPIRSESRPAWGASAMMSRVQGRNDAPACVGE